MTQPFDFDEYTLKMRPAAEYTDRAPYIAIAAHAARIADLIRYLCTDADATAEPFISDDSCDDLDSYQTALSICIAAIRSDYRYFACKTLLDALTADDPSMLANMILATDFDSCAYFDHFTDLPSNPFNLPYPD